MIFFERFIFGKLIDRRITLYQNDLLQKYYEEVQNTYQTMRGWRHDYHNHIQAMLALADHPEELKEYLLNLSDDLCKINTVLKTGNIMIDAILNSKISLIKSHSILVNAKAIVPKELSITEIDLCTIIGNLLDNAMEACLRQTQESERFIRIYIGVLKKQLYISVQNSVGETMKKSGERFVSMKSAGGHGLGLVRIDRVVKKNNGFILRQNEDGVFASEVFLPI